MQSALSWASPLVLKMSSTGGLGFGEPLLAVLASSTAYCRMAVTVPVCVDWRPDIWLGLWASVLDYSSGIILSFPPSGL